MPAIVKTEGLGRDFGGTRALDRIDLTLEAGSARSAWSGRTARAKTTFFSVLCGFLRPTRGTVEVLGGRRCTAICTGASRFFPRTRRS